MSYQRKVPNVLPGIVSNRKGHLIILAFITINVYMYKVGCVGQQQLQRVHAIHCCPKDPLFELDDSNIVKCMIRCSTLYVKKVGLVI